VAVELGECAKFRGVDILLHDGRCGPLPRPLAVRVDRRHHRKEGRSAGAIHRSPLRLPEQANGMAVI